MPAARGEHAMARGRNRRDNDCDSPRNFIDNAYGPTSVKPVTSIVVSLAMTARCTIAGTE
jgi:hypothetical protein